MQTRSHRKLLRDGPHSCNRRFTRGAIGNEVPFHVMRRPWSLAIRRPWNLAIVAALTLASHEALACSCVPPGDAATELKLSDAVFTGEVTALVIAPRWWRVAQIQPPSDLLTESDPRQAARVERVTIAVDQSWKGITREVVTVYTTFDCCMCGFGFQIGQQYLMYASWSKSHAAYFISACSRSKTADSAAAEISQLGQAKYDFQAGRTQIQIQQLFQKRKRD